MPEERREAFRWMLEEFRVSIFAPELGTAQPVSAKRLSELGVDFTADPIEIGFNAKYLLDIGAQLRTDTAVFKLADAGSPTLIQDDGDANALFVLMPMRV